jgi:hypothetical protein
MNSITNYWLKYYVNERVLLCALCGNTGRIDTRQTAISPAGVKAGDVMWCICPNGQAMRKAENAPENADRPSVSID